jgi:3-dehydroquinate dehydratase
MINQGAFTHKSIVMRDRTALQTRPLVTTFSLHKRRINSTADIFSLTLELATVVLSF